MKLNEKLISLKELYCIKCGGFLNGSIMISKESKNICNKCFDKTLDGKNCIRNIPLEKIIALLEIPCPYSSKGCKEVLNHTEISSHESKCQYGPAICPMLGCQLVSSFNELQNHLCLEHINNIIESEDLTFEIDIDANGPNEIIKLLSWKHLLLLLGINILESDLLITVQCIAATDLRLNYLLNEIIVGNFTCKYNMKNEVKNYLEDKDGLKICIADQKKISSLMKIKLAIFNGDEMVQVDPFLLKQLECPVCFEAMLPPIYIICSNGHTVCSNCCGKILSLCPVCKSKALKGPDPFCYCREGNVINSLLRSIRSLRSYQLEQVSENTSHYCTYRSKGCMFIANGTEIIKHQKNCTFREFVCPYKTQGNCCSFTGLYSDVVKHLEEAHSAKDKLTVPLDPSVISTEPKCWENFMEDITESGYFRCLVCFDRIFIINYKYTYCSSTCKNFFLHCWCVLSEDEENFKLEVTINGYLNKITASIFSRQYVGLPIFKPLEIPFSFLKDFEEYPNETGLSVKISKIK